MIYTVTFNPSLDYVVDVPQFHLGKTNRTVREALFPGGKGVNVSIVLQALGVESTALGFRAGFVGKEIQHRLEALGIRSDLIPLENGNSRINVKLQTIEGTEINGMGPSIPQDKVQAMLTRLDALNAGDVLVLAGSIPSSMSADLYRDILQRLNGRGVLTVVDAAGELLAKVLPHHPFLIKPNHHELGQLFGVELDSRAEVIPYARRLQAMGAGNVLVSMAGQGAVLVTQDGQVLSSEAPQGTLVSGVGAGDSMVAGFLAGWLRSQSYTDAFRLAVAAGSATAFSQHLADRQTILEVLKSVHPSFS